MGVMERYNEKKKKQSNTGKVSSNIGVKERFELNKKYADLSTDNFVEQKQAVQPVNQSVPVNSISKIDNAQERKAYRKENDSRIAALDRQISALQDKITEYNNKYSKSGGYVPSASNYNRPGINQVNTYNKWRSEAAEYNKQLKSLSDKRDALVAENNIYDRGQGVLDSYYDYTQKADFNAASSKRNYNNASRQELNDYDIRNDASLSYYGADGSLYNGMNEKVSADYWDNLSAPKIEDKLGLFLSTEQKERQEAYGNLSKESTWEKIIKDGSDGSWDELNEDEQKIYYYLLNTSGSEAAYKFLDEMKAELNKRSDAKSKQKIDDAGIGAKLAANVASVPASVFGGVTGFIEDTANILRGKEINPYSSAHSLQNFSQNVRTSTAEDINKATDDVSFLGITLGDVYQSGMSAADSALGIVTGSKTYGALMGMSSAASTAKDLYERGATNAQIAVESLLSGAAEMAFEKWSLDKFTDRFLKKGKKGVLEKVKNVLIQGGVEASEETFTELANVLTDSIVMAGQSNYNVNVEKYINDGKTEAQAQALALRDAAGDVWKAAVGGFISGDIMGGVGTAVISDAHNKKGIDIDKGARAIYNAAVKSAALGTDSAKQGLYDSLEMRGYTPQQGILRGIAEVTGKKFETLSETGLDAQTLSVVEQISDKLQVAFDAGFFNENFSRVSEAVNSYAASVKVGQDAAGLIIMDQAVNAKPSKKSKIISAAQERYQNNNITTIEQVRELTKAEIKNMLNAVNNQTADNSVNYLDDIVKVIGDAVNKEGVRLNETQRRAVNDILLRGKVEGNLNTILEDEHTTNILSNILGLHIDGKKSVTAVKNRVKSMLAAYKSGNGKSYNNAAKYRKLKMDMIDAQLKSAGISDPEIVAGFRNAVLNGDLTRKQAKAIAESEAAFNIFAKNSGLRLDTKSSSNDLIRSARTLAGFDLSADDAYYFAERDIRRTVELSNSVPDGETGIFDSDTGRLILNKNAELQKKLSYTLAQHVIRDNFNSEKIKKYSYNELIKKPDMKITKISGISEDKFNEYKAKKSNLIDDAMKNARLAGNKKNTDTAVYLHCDDLNEDIMISSKSLRHGAARIDNTYANICLNLSDIIKNSIAVNELIPREGTDGSVVLLSVAENENSYVLVRTIVNNRTWKANDYKIIYAVKKQNIKKEDVGVKPKDYLKNEGSHTSSINSISDNSEKVNNKNQTLKKEDVVGNRPTQAFTENGGSQTSSTISISNLLEIVKDKKLINSVLSDDVLNALNSKRIVDENVSKNLLDTNNKDDLVYSVIDYMKSHDVDVYSELKRAAKKYRSYMMGDQTRLNGSLLSEENLQREIVADWLSNAFLNQEALEQLVTDDMQLAMELFERVSAEQSKQGISKDFKEFAAKVRNTLYSYLNTDLKTVKNKTEHVAEILTEEPAIKKKKRGLWSYFKELILDKGMVFENLSKKAKNRNLEAKWNFIRYADGNAQRLIGKGANGVKSLKYIQAEVEKTGLIKEFYEYLYHKHNVDRMNLESRYENVKNKPVFSSSVTSEMSQKIADEYEFAEPKFKEYAQDVYSYMNYLRNLMVENGLISRETADLWAEMYPHYIPIRRVGDTGLNINVPLDTGRTSVNAPVKAAKGGSKDILPLFDTMAQRTMQTYKAVARNSFGVELKNTLGTTIKSDTAKLDDIIDGIDTQEDLIQKGKNGKNPTFTVFENGERVTFEITDEMYDALKPKSEKLAYRNKFLKTLSNIQRGLLTEKNPVFLLTNSIKDSQDILINSQHPVRTYINLPKAVAEMVSKGKYYTEYMSNGGEQNTYFDNESNTFAEDKKIIRKIIGMPLDIISVANNFIEKLPRLAEYITSRESGRSIEVSMLDAARVTTNFAAGGDVTKFLNGNGCTFLNASVQGAMQQVRNIREAKMNGLKGWVGLAARYAIAGIPAIILNWVLWDNDEDYEELSEYVKENYYVIAKYGDGEFVRIPKGRALAVIQNAMEQIKNAATGDDDVDLKNFLELAVTNLAPNNPIDNNIIAPIMQAANNKTWYGEDLIPARLQDLPEAEQFDESTDAISKWLGEKLNYSPYKINYLLNQYSGGIGDVVLPMLTPEAESGDNSLAGNLVAPLKDKFTTDSVMNNQNISDFYDTVKKLTTNANSSEATDEDILKYKYINSINTELSELYKQKREIQNSSHSDDRKYSAVRNIQIEIDELAKESLNNYNKVNIDGMYAYIDEYHFRWKEPSENSDEEAGWVKINDKQLEKQKKVTSALNISPSDYWSNKEEYDYAYDNPDKYAVSKAVGGYDAFKTYSGELYDIKADKDKNGNSISGSRKEKVLDYINNLNIDYYKKIILFKSEYNADDRYNHEIIDYLNSRDDISYSEMASILKELGFTVLFDGTIK